MTTARATSIGFSAVLMWSLLALFTIGSAPVPPFLLNALCFGIGGTLALIAPPYLPYAPAWQAAGIDLGVLHVVEASPRDALWAFEQCLRSGACAAVLGWPVHTDGPALRRLQVAADSGECLGFALRDRRHAANPSAAALRVEAIRDAQGGTHWKVRKCRGGPAPAQSFALVAP